MAEETFLSSKLDWDDIGARAPCRLARLVSPRARHPPGGDRAPTRRRSTHGGRYEIVGEAAVSVRWSIADGRELALAANLSAVPSRTFRSAAGADPVQRGNDRRERRVWALFGALVDRGSMDKMTEHAQHRRSRARPTGCSSTRSSASTTPARLAPYLARLGISHVYASPYLMARPGSTHGYDIVDHDKLNPELGGDAAFARHGRGAQARTGSASSWISCPTTWASAAPTIRSGWTCSNGGRIRTTPAGSTSTGTRTPRYLHNKLLVPFLGDQYGLELERGHLRLKCDFDAGSFAVWAYDVHKLPICPLHYGRILGTRDPGPGAAGRRLRRAARLAPADRPARRRAEGGDGGAGRATSRTCARAIEAARRRASTARQATSTPGGACTP